MGQLPLARQRNLIVRELPDEVLVYDLDTDRAYCLNRTAALIWKNCAGKKSAREIALLLEQESKSPVSEQVVMLGLEELAASDLLKEGTWRGLQPGGLSRRQLMKRLGLAATLGLPLITSVIAPTAAQAQTIVVDPCAVPEGKPEGCPCGADSECASFNCNEAQCGPGL
jgi:hypothetical protein